jgi:Chaperone for flagella basal body P-ring formation
MRRGISFLIMGLALSHVQAAVPEADAQEPDILVVNLRPAVTARESLIQVGTVATLSGGTQSIRKKAAELDLIELAPGAASLVIGREQISIRLQIAGFDSRRFRIEGKKVTVSPAAEVVTEDSLVSVAGQLVQRRLPKYADNVSILLAMPVEVPTLAIGSKDRIHLEAELPQGKEPLGLIRVPVIVFKNGERLASIPVNLNVSYVQRASAAEMDAEAEHPILIKGHDLVRLVARIGDIRVMARAEALQEGRAGEVIRVRNIDSDKIVSGRVAEAGVVEVDY